MNISSKWKNILILLYRLYIGLTLMACLFTFCVAVSENSKTLWPAILFIAAILPYFLRPKRVLIKQKSNLNQNLLQIPRLL